MGWSVAGSVAGSVVGSEAGRVAGSEGPGAPRLELPVGAATRRTTHAREAGTGSCSRSPSHSGESVLERTPDTRFCCEKLGRTYNHVPWRLQP